MLKTIEASTGIRQEKPDPVNFIVPGSFSNPGIFAASQISPPVQNSAKPSRATILPIDSRVFIEFNLTR